MKKTLNIKPITQIGSNGCWGAVAEMLYSYYLSKGIKIPFDIFSAKNSSKPGNACELLANHRIRFYLFSTTIPSSDEIIEDIVMKENPIISLLNENKIVNEEDMDAPGTHWVIISGVEYNTTSKVNKIEITDPKNGSKTWVSYKGNNTMYDGMYFQNSSYKLRQY